MRNETLTYRRERRHVAGIIVGACLLALDIALMLYALSL